MMQSRLSLAVLMLGVVAGLSGCATLNSLIQLPFQIVGSSLELVGKLLSVASKVPIPPGVL